MLNDVRASVSVFVNFVALSPVTHMRNLALTLFIAATLGGFVAGCGAASSTPANVPDPALVATLEPLDVEDLERQIHVLVNSTRSQFGLTELGWNEDLHPIALAHSENMAARDEFAHEIQGRGPVDRYEAGGYNCRVPAGANRFLTGGENLYLGNRIGQFSRDSAGNVRATQINTEAALASQAIQGWMQSPPHRENLLKEHWQTETIAVFVDRYGRVWITQNFC